jgi:acyl carrier protein
MQEAECLEAEIKALIIEVLVLEDVTPEDIETDAPLFVEGLGLDSIDALELAMVLEERYGVTMSEDPDENRKIFESVRSLATFVAANQTSR